MLLVLCQFFADGFKFLLAGSSSVLKLIDSLTRFINLLDPIIFLFGKMTHFFFELGDRGGRLLYCLGEFFNSKVRFFERFLGSGSLAA